MARVGVLVIRIWLADGDLRARLTQVDDVAVDGVSVAVVGSAEELCTAVLRWADRLRESAPQPPASQPPPTAGTADGTPLSGDGGSA